MKNLKRALSFAVAAVMLVGMMAVGTSAFTDDEKIVNTTAVNVMNQLNIINGKPDGSFDPEATVSRGEMAKMICVALNGGKDPILDTTASSYPDTVGHWAAGYIEYCTTMGIVAGSTDGNFYPNAPITGVEAAKMVLVALGYNAKYEKFVNNKDWSNNISIVANNNGMWEDVTSLPGAPISRDNAAQLLYNGMSVNQVTYDFRLGTDENGALTSVPFVISAGKGDILLDKFGLKEDTAVLNDVAYDAEKDEYTYTYSSNPGDAGLLKGSVDFSDLYMQEVTILWKQVTGADDKLYGMYGNGSVMAEGNYGDLTNTYDATEEGVKFGDDYIATDATVNGGVLTVKYFLDPAATTGAQAAHAVKILDTDGDDYADTVVVYPFAVEQVAFVGKTQVTVGTTPYKFEDHNIYTGIAQDDWAQVAPAANTVDGKATITKMTAITGTVDAIKNGEMKIDGAWYVMVDGSELSLNTEYDLIAVGKYIYDATPVEETVSLTDVIYVVNADSAVTSGLNAGTQKVKVMFVDGTTAVVTVDAIEAGADDTITNTNNVSVGALYTYKTDKDGNYELTAFDASDYIVGTLVDDANPATVNADEGKFTTTNGIYRLNDDAILFVIDGDGEVSVVKAADANKWKDTAVGTLYGEEKNGFVYAQLGLLTTTGTTADSDAVYGVVVDDYYKVKVDDTEYYKVSVWNGTENVELTVATSDVANIGKGQLITWTVDSDNVADVAKFGAEKAVTAYDGETIVFDNGAEYTFAEEAVILYVDSEEVAGVEGGKISIADKAQNGSYIKNVYVVTDDAAHEVDVLVVEINNEWTGDVMGVPTV